jgi:riboflavin biosynthesis pyrimidine reductase
VSGQPPAGVFHDWPASDEDLIGLYPRDAQPVLRVNFIASADGAVTVDGLSGGLHGPGDKEIFDVLRTVCDALIVAAGTVTAERYDALRLTERARAWRTAAGLPAYPNMVIVSGSLNLDVDQLVFTDAPIRPIVITRAAAPRDRLAAVSRVAEVVIAGEQEVDLAEAVAGLHARGATQLLCEGGPRLFGSMIAADLVTELCLTVSPLLTGGGTGRIAAGAPSVPRRMALRHVLTLEDMLFLRYGRA